MNKSNHDTQLTKFAIHFILILSTIAHGECYGVCALDAIQLVLFCVRSAVVVVVVVVVVRSELFYQHLLDSSLPKALVSRSRHT